MGQSAQLLYFHLGMQADDDGFVSPQRVMRMVGAQADDLKVLEAKRFVIAFPKRSTGHSATGASTIPSAWTDT